MYGRHSVGASRGIALGRRWWPFADSDRGGQRAAAISTLIATTKLWDVDPQAWLADVLARIADHPASRFDALLRGTGKRPRIIGPNHRRLITGPRSSADAYGEREVTAAGSVIGRSGEWGRQQRPPLKPME